MICDECHGERTKVIDGEHEVCWWCRGTGRVSWWKYFALWCGVQKDRLKDRIAYTKLGNRYWRWRGKERQARRLVRERTRFELMELHGRRIYRLRVFADAVESGTNCGDIYRRESRLVAEAARALELADGKH